jgi:hypothetical protein
VNMKKLNPKIKKDIEKLKKQKVISKKDLEQDQEQFTENALGLKRLLLKSKQFLTPSRSKKRTN